MIRMEQPNATDRVLLPRSTPLQTEYQSSNTQNLGGPLPSSTITMPLPKRRQPKNATITDQEWERQRPNFIRLFIEQDLALKDVMRKMEEDYNFKASRKQYNTKIAQWRTGKNVKDNEMRAIIRKETQRQMQYPPKNSIFRVRKHPVEPEKIARFKRDKGVDDANAMVTDAGTPSDISCDTPQPESRVSSAQGLRMTPNDGASQLLSLVRSMTPFNSYASALSPRLQMGVNSPYLCRVSPDLVSIDNSPDLQQQQQPSPVPSGIFSVARPNSSPHWHYNSSQYRHHSPLHWRASLSPPMFFAETSNCPPNSEHGNMALHPFTQDTPLTNQPSPFTFDWFGSYVDFSRSSSSPSDLSSDNSIGNLVRSFIPKIDTYEAHKEHEVFRRQWWLYIKQVLKVSASYDCDTCRALEALVIFEMYIHQSVCHPDSFSHRVDIKNSVSETLHAFLPELNSGESSVLSFARGVTWVLLKEGRYREIERIMKVVILEMEHRPEWSSSQRSITSLYFADISISCGRHGYARKLIQDTLGAEFSIIATFANNADIEFTEMDVAEIQDPGIWLEDIELDTLAYYYGAAEDGLATIRQHIGENRMADEKVYLIAIWVLRRLNWAQVLYPEWCRM